VSLGGDRDKVGATTPVSGDVFDNALPPERAGEGGQEVTNPEAHFS